MYDNLLRGGQGKDPEDIWASSVGCAVSLFGAALILLLWLLFGGR